MSWREAIVVALLLLPWLLAGAGLVAWWEALLMVFGVVVVVLTVIGIALWDDAPRAADKGKGKVRRVRDDKAIRQRRYAQTKEVPKKLMLPGKGHRGRRRKEYQSRRR